jgi:hypothetical protein
MIHCCVLVLQCGLAYHVGGPVEQRKNQAGV